MHATVAMRSRVEEVVFSGAYIKSLLTGRVTTCSWGNKSLNSRN